MTGSSKGHLIAALLAASCVGLFISATASASPNPFWKVADGGAPGTAPEQFLPRDTAVDPANGRVLVAEGGKRRITELSAWGEFMRAFGWGVLDGADELQECTAQSGCQIGLEDSGPGHIVPVSIALAPDGGILVYEPFNLRVQKLDRDGAFVWMAGGEVNKTKAAIAASTGQEENLCTRAQVEAGDVCGKGVAGTGQGEVSGGISYGTDRLAVGAGGEVLVADRDHIEVLNPDGTFAERIAPSVVAGEMIQTMALDGGGNIYLTILRETFPQTENEILKLDSSGALIRTFAVTDPVGIAVTSDGTLYSSSRGPGRFVIAYAPTGEQLIPSATESANEERFSFLSDELSSIPSLTISEACGIDGHQLLVTAQDWTDWINGVKEEYVRAYGPAPDSSIPGCEPPAREPTITDQYAVSATADSAVVKAKINPRFWADTSYYVEYGTAPCHPGGCERRSPDAPGELALGTAVLDGSLTTKAVPLGGLQPRTKYYFRFVARSSGGGPVVGVGESEAEATFTTPRVTVEATDTCPNDSVRAGLSQRLPNCRAYELVSPVDKKNSDAIALNNISSYPASFDRAADSGGALAYTTYRAYETAASGPYSSHYIASRQSAGWQTRPISPPRGINILGSGYTLEAEFRYLSSDLCTGWLMHDTDPVLADDAVEGFANFYSADLCSSPTIYKALTTATPSIEPYDFRPELQGVSADATTSLIRVNAKLTNNAVADRAQVYASRAGTTRLVCVLPNGLGAGTNCSAGGTDSSYLDGRRARVNGAISTDGSRVIWTSTWSPNPSSPKLAGPGTIYVRMRPTQLQSKVEAGECVDPTRACTYPISELASPEPARFWAARPDGSAVLFTTTGGDLYRSDLDAAADGSIAAEPHLLARGVSGLLGSSVDLNRIYFVSTDDLAPGAEPGAPSLYHYDDGAIDFVASLSVADAVVETAAHVPSPASGEVIGHSAQVTPDGRAVVFMSTGSPTGFDNRDVQTGERNAQVYVHRVGAEVQCISCNPTGARSVGRNVAANVAGKFWASARIPTADSQLYATRAISEDGDRVFFESFDSLLPRDGNGRQDVYQWEAPGKAGCATSSPSFSDAAGGCVSLISTGQSEQDSAIVDSTPSGSDVFFTTGQSLVAQDPESIDIYDARIGGGMDPPPAPPSPCQGDSCQGLPQAPPALTPASANAIGPGNPKPRAKKWSKGGKRRACPKGKRKVKRGKAVKCVAKKGKQAKRARARR